MITLATEEQLRCFNGQTEAAVRVSGLFHAYGADTSFLRFYTDEYGAFASVMDGTAVVFFPKSAPENREEWAWFLATQPDIQCVRSDAHTVACLTEFSLHTSGNVLTAPQGVVPTGNTQALTPREVYGVLADVFSEQVPAFEGFYVDLSHRIRHGCCRTAGVLVNGTPVASALTVAETAQAAVIGGVATRPEYRRKGYARACVSALAAELQAEQKTVLIAPIDPSAEALYMKWGFFAAGTWGEATR